VEHPFGLPIWKPALYKKSRSVTRNADAALHSVPSAQAERHLLPGNIFWALFFGWWMALICVAIAVVLYLIPLGGDRYSSLVFGLGWYLAWPFGKYLEGDFEEEFKVEDAEGGMHGRRWSSASEGTIRALSPSSPPPPGSSNTANGTRAGDGSSPQHAQTVSWLSDSVPGEPIAIVAEGTALLRASKSYGATAPFGSATPSGVRNLPSPDFLGKIAFWLTLVTIIAPVLLIVCMFCWALVVTIPMAKLLWALIQYLFRRPTQIRFCAAPPAVVVAQSQTEPAATDSGVTSPLPQPRPQFSIKHPRLSQGQVAPSGHPTSTVLLCTYRAAGLQYVKYTVGGVNIIFVNLLPIVFLVIFDGTVLLSMVEHLEKKGEHVPLLLAVVASKGLLFVLSLLSVIPLSYFIGMAVASISAQSSIGMGAVINATFGSIIEIVLYAIALRQRKGLLVEGSIVGSLLAGVLLMPGMSMCSMALRRKEQTFNAKSAGVTSMMLIMAIIGALAPTLFYQTYGNIQLVCTGCPQEKGNPGNAPWVCTHCYYRRPNPVHDPFYQSTVKKLMYLCAGILLFSYLVGLWFSLRTHASQIWQNPQPLLQHAELPTGRTSLYQKPGPATAQQLTRGGSLNRRPSGATAGNIGGTDHCRSPAPSQASTIKKDPPSSPTARRVSQAPPLIPPIMDSVDQAVKQTGLQNLQLGSTLTQEELQRVVAAATVSALRHQEAQGHLQMGSRPRSTSAAEGDQSAQHGHDAPSWSRTTSASVLVTCTALYAIIADILVDVVDVVLKGSGIDEKFLGVTLFALVPNTTEFMNAISFALNGNIALSMEIGSAYALQVCLLQIPAMVAFSAWYNPKHMGEVAKSFTLVFPKWDAIALILSMFLMTYTYIEARSNYHRGSILILSYIVLVAGFYFAPPTSADVDQGHDESQLTDTVQYVSLTIGEYVKWYLTSWW
jgi:Ca2+:H+ antiporter